MKVVPTVRLHNLTQTVKCIPILLQLLFSTYGMERKPTFNFMCVCVCLCNVGRCS